MSHSCSCDQFVCSVHLFGVMHFVLILAASFTCGPYLSIEHCLQFEPNTAVWMLWLSWQRKEVILPCFKPLQRGIAACMNCPNTRVIRMVHSLLSRLMSIFPTESATSNVASKFEELECLYACVSKIVYEGLANYEKSVALIGICFNCHFYMFVLAFPFLVIIIVITISIRDNYYALSDS